VAAHACLLRQHLLLLLPGWQHLLLAGAASWVAALALAGWVAALDYGYTLSNRDAQL